MSAYNILSYTICGSNAGLPDESVRNQACARPSVDRKGNDNQTFVVCDGMGGPGFGDVAANVVCDSLYEGMSRLSATVSDEQIYCTVENTYDALDGLDVGSEGKAGATAAMLVLSPESAMLAHVGNCRVYHIRPGIDPDSTSILYASVDHTLANYLVRKGSMSPDEAIRLGRHKVLTRAMQQHMEQRCMPDIYRTSDLCDSDYFLLITSEMASRINDYGIRSIFSREGGNDRSKVNQLRLLAQECSGDHAAIVVRMRKPSPGSQTASLATSSAGTGSVRSSRSESIATFRNSVDIKSKNKRNKITMAMSNPAAVADLFKSNKRLIKLLFAIMAVLTLVMIIYYLFIHEDEQLRQAGNATESAVVTQLPGEETYGYETDASYVTNDTYAPDDNDNAAEELESVDENEDAVTGEATAAEPVSEPQQVPQPQNNEPILQE